MGFNSDMGGSQSWETERTSTDDANDRRKQSLPKYPSEEVARQALNLLYSNPGSAFNRTANARAATTDLAVLSALDKVQIRGDQYILQTETKNVILSAITGEITTRNR